MRTYNVEPCSLVGQAANVVPQVEVMRIALFYYSVAANGSIGLWHLHLLKKLCHAHEFTVFATRFENPCPERIRWVRVPVPTRPAALTFVAYHLMAAGRYWVESTWKGRRFDLVQMVGSQLSFGDISSAHFCDRAYLKNQWQYSRSTGMRRLSHWCDYKLRAIAEPWVYKRVRMITVHSNGLAREMNDEYPFVRDKMRFCPNVVDVERMRRPVTFDREGARKTLQMERDDVVLAFVALGAFERKGFPLLLEALAGICNPRLKLIVVGGPQGMVSRYQKRAAELGLRQRVVFLGNRADVRPYLWMSDALVLPSQYEAFPVVSLEAAAAGLPILATRINGVEEILEDGVTGIELGRDTEGVKRGLLGFLATDASTRRQMGERAREAAQSYDLENFARAWQGVYHDVLLG